MATIVNGQTQYQSGDSLPTVGSPEYNAALSPLQGNNYSTSSISTDVLKTSPYNPLPTPTTSDAYSQTLARSVNGLTLTPPTDASGNQNQADTLRQLLGIQATKGQYETQVQNDVGLFPKEQALNDINTEALTKAKYYQDQAQNIRDTFQGTTAGLSDKLAELDRNRSNEMANISIRKLAAQGDVNTALTIIDQKVKALYEPVDNYIKNLIQYKDFFNNDLTESQKLKLQADINYEKEKRDSLMEATKNAIQAATENGAPTSVLNAIDTASKDPKATVGSIYSAAGTYGQDNLRRLQIAKAQADLLKANQDNQILSIKDAQALGVPYGTTKGQAAALGKVPGATSEANALKISALDSAKQLMTALDKGNLRTGINSIFGTIPGTAFRDSRVLYDNLKSLLSLDNVKLLKGQGQVSDAERRLLEEASSQLDISQSTPAFKTALEKIIKSLSGPGVADRQVVNENGKQVIYEKAADGKYYPVK